MAIRTETLPKVKDSVERRIWRVNEYLAWAVDHGLSEIAVDPQHTPKWVEKLIRMHDVPFRIRHFRSQTGAFMRGQVPILS